MMKNIYLKITYLALLVALCSCRRKIVGEEFGTVEGKVVSAVDLSLANVKVSNEFRYCFTDEEGKFVVANVKLFF
jgi:hypothetical protein